MMGDVMRRAAQLAVAMAMAATLGVETAAAQDAGPEIRIGIGVDDVMNDAEAAAVALGAQTAPLFELGPIELRVGAAAEANTDADLWAGAGVSATWPIGAAFRIEGSFMPGGYVEGEKDLGHAFIMRSQIGASYKVMDAARLGVAFEHKSNGGVGDHNPGVETLFFTVSSGF